MKITIICVGKLKEDFYKKAVSEYAKRLGRYCRLEIIEVADEKTPEDAGPVMEEQIKEREAARILKHVKEDAYVFTLEITGSQPDSLAFSRMLSRLTIQGKSHFQFIIGGSLGLHKSVSLAANQAVSFSNMTFPHQLMRVILLEQIYRSYRIMNGEPYHK
ncbi:MAG: 23S rRNA (pseudouridine(1915)-N(3))-methyltransferase RlmH [Lachnospiraceae bacterium]|jgi:23S rRNA (pseudouridine1915-N3)-methyltransferase|nr:23S rRNA (pseudouridine(1915)-N(3))-methyltransferase RlmH [Lachnospiraceae bacterium]MCI9096823.1 23S rRNA (pseudouridine(1915)-N(3))-methyltransferase RlmH [Lachnospiraceae bacterium]MCI9204103.1 23S rRNA (pseudouridine(1915)-N(3))-methyltransferase RlmH [Lachnospiraceae bacterium]